MGYSKIYLIGHSMGGVIATHLARKYKEVLSANKEVFITVMGVEGGDDLQTKITREEFEEMNKYVFDELYTPIQDVLDKTNLTNVTKVVKGIAGTDVILTIKRDKDMA